MSLSVSVVLCTYNGAAHLQSQLGSLRAQTHRIDELVVFDDASSDGTVALLDEGMLDIAKRITVHRRVRNVGPAQNFSDALSRANGDVVFLCDQDDVWAPWKVEHVLAYLRESPEVDLLQHDANLIDNEGEVTHGSLYRLLGVTQEGGAVLFQQLLRRNLAPGCSLAARRALLERALPVPSGFMHDEWLALLAAAFGRFRQVGEELISYRLHPKNTLGLHEIGLSAKVGRRFGETAHARAAKIERLGVLKIRLARSGGSQQECEVLLDEALAHLRMRLSLPQGLLARAPLVVNEWQTGRYARHGSGGLSALRDLLGF